MSKNLHGICFRPIFFPSAGYRYCATGALTDVGLNGYAWSSLPLDSGSARFRFVDSDVAFSSLQRSYGFPLRCVQAFAGSVSGRSSSRLRGTFITRWGHCRSSVRWDLSGQGFREEQTRFVRVLQMTALLWVRCCVLTVFRCVVSKNLLGICFGWVFFPSAGFRHYSSGALTSVGAGGYLWSTFVSDCDAGYLYFSSPYAYLQFYSRGYGLSLRCVQAFANSVARNFFPSAGSLPRDTGAPTGIGSNGYGWSSVSEGASGYRFLFYGAFAASYDSPRSYGLALRCVQAFANSVARNFFPPAGYRRAGGGELSSVGSWGEYWASSPIGAEGCYLELQPTAGYLRINYRAFAFSLRCVQAFADSVSGRFLPVCGASALRDGNNDERWFRWAMLVFGTVRFQCCQIGL